MTARIARWRSRRQGMQLQAGQGRHEANRQCVSPSAYLGHNSGPGNIGHKGGEHSYSNSRLEAACKQGADQHQLNGCGHEGEHHSSEHHPHTACACNASSLSRQLQNTRHLYCVADLLDSLPKFKFAVRHALSCPLILRCLLTRHGRKRHSMHAQTSWHQIKHQITTSAMRVAGSGMQGGIVM